MVKRTLLAFAIAVLSTAIFAQITGEASGQNVGEGPRAMILGTQNAFYIDFVDVSASFVEKGWKDFASTYGKIKKVKKSDEMLIAGAQVVGIGGASTLNLYSRTESIANGARQYLWVEAGGRFINTAEDGDAAKNTGDLLRDFAQKIKVDLIVLELDEQQKALDNLDKDLQKLRKDKDKLHDTIEDAQKRIAEAEADIAKNIQDQEIRLQEIEKQRQVVDKVKTKLENARMRKS